VILSALVHDTDQTSGMLAGADQYLTKPTKPQELVAAILHAIALSQDERLTRLRSLATLDEEPDQTST
jgi:DNA-binding response OmpR family regulator